MTVTTPRAADTRRNPMTALAVLFAVGLALTYQRKIMFELNSTRILICSFKNHISLRNLIKKQVHRIVYR